jgi:hypothetical protein
MASGEDLALECYDHTKLSAVNTCPTYGVLRYQMNLRMPGDGRSMALEAGSALHECFAFVRLVSLIEQLTHEGKPKAFVDAVWSHHGIRLFGKERLEAISHAVEQADDVIDLCKRGSITVLDSGGFHDDPRDRRRTLSNLEECIYAYVNRWRFDHIVWMRDRDDPTSDVGIEIPFDVVVNIPTKMQFRLTGRIDGIHYASDGKLAIHDNKSASRLGEAWSMAQQVSHQFTGYCVAASVFTKDSVRNVEVHGLAVPLPKTYDFGGVTREVMRREDHHFTRWLAWLVHTVEMTRKYANDPYNAPKFTHSCSRYFRPCIFVPFCVADDEEQKLIVSELVFDEWTPLDKPLLDGIGNE